MESVRLREAAERVKAGTTDAVDIREHPDVRDDDLAVLAGLTNLKNLNLDSAPITDTKLHAKSRRLAVMGYCPFSESR